VPGRRLPGALAIRWRDRRRLAKKRARAIEYSRAQDKKRRLYRELIAAPQASRAELQAAAAGLAKSAEATAERWRAQVDDYLPLIARISAQSASAGCSTARRCRLARSWSACSSPSADGDPCVNLLGQGLREGRGVRRARIRQRKISAVGIGG
jgi:hypothetical protein